MDRTQGGNIDEEESSGIKSIKANEISQPDKLDEKVITDNLRFPEHEFQLWEIKKVVKNFKKHKNR